MNEENLELISRACRGDLSAYRECIERYSARIYAIAYQMVGNAEDSKDITQEVFIRLYRSLDKFKPTSRFTTWLYRLTVNMSIDFQRKNARFRHVSINDVKDVLAVKDSKPLPDVQAERNELRGAINKLTRGLTVNQRSVFVLRDLQGFSTEEIAQILKNKPSTVRVHLAKARAQIKKALIEYYPDLVGGENR